jgi:hypothetical protein
VGTLEDEYGTSKKKMYVNAKMILVESAPGMGKGR